MRTAYRWHSIGGGTVMSTAERALAYVTARSVLVPHGCRYWVNALTDDGYAKAVITEGGRERTVRVHRWLYEQVVGPAPLPASSVVAHACNESLCVRLEHLSGASQRANLAQMAAQAAVQAAPTTAALIPAGRWAGRRRSRPPSVTGSTCRRSPRRCARATRARSFARLWRVGTTPTPTWPRSRRATPASPNSRCSDRLGRSRGAQGHMARVAASRRRLRRLLGAKRRLATEREGAGPAPVAVQPGRRGPVAVLMPSRMQAREETGTACLG